MFLNIGTIQVLMPATEVKHWKRAVIWLMTQKLMAEKMILSKDVSKEWKNICTKTLNSQN